MGWVSRWPECPQSVSDNVRKCGIGSVQREGWQLTVWPRKSQLITLIGQDHRAKVEISEKSGFSRVARRNPSYKTRSSMWRTSCSVAAAWRTGVNDGKPVSKLLLDWPDVPIPIPPSQSYGFQILQSQSGCIPICQWAHNTFFAED